MKDRKPNIPKGKKGNGGKGAAVNSTQEDMIGKVEALLAEAQDDLDKARLGRELAEADLALAEADLAEAKADREQADQDSAKAEKRAAEAKKGGQRGLVVRGFRPYEDEE